MRASFLFLASASTALATNLYVLSYSGIITTLELSQSQNGSYALEETFAHDGCSSSPSWLTVDKENKVIHCLDENLSGGNGSISSYRTLPSGQLTKIDHHSVISGPVSSIIYNGGKAQAVAHYGGSSVTSWKILEDGSLEQLQSFTFNLTSPGVDPVRQDASHPHQVIMDPTDSYIISPDLGADLVRIFSINHNSSELTPSTPLAVPPGSGPRHGAFVVLSDQTYFYLINELSNIVVAYKVHYGCNSLSFTEIFSSSTFGNATVPSGVRSAEAIISPDQKFLLTSSRNDTTFTIPNFDHSNSTDIISDSLQTWGINADGTLTFLQMTSAGGSFPRHLSVNKDGSLAAVGLQYSASVVIVQRKPDGTFGDFVAKIDVPGEITSVFWDEL